MKLSFLRAVLCIAFTVSLANLRAQDLIPLDLRCEYRVNPAGIDSQQPRLSWELRSDKRNEAQTAYQILVASSPATLAKDEGDLWDSGKVVSDQDIQVAYSGKDLKSRERAFWKVRVWGNAGKESAWSEPAAWSMGLLEKLDWQAKWICDPKSITEAEETVSQGPSNGYHSEMVNSPDVVKWVGIDLGTPNAIDAVRLFPARPYDWQPDTPGFLFPVRFKIEVADHADFTDSRTVVDLTQSDQANPRTDAPVYRFTPTTARFVRLVVTKLRLRDTDNYGIALAEMQVLNQGKNLAKGAKVLALDTIETGPWSKANLVDGRSGRSPNAVYKPRAATMVRKSFPIESPIKRAVVYVTGLGLYELRLNGQRVGDQLLAPEWTDYRKRIQYQTYDVTSLLRTGNNAAGAMLGEGWYSSKLMGIPRDAYGSHPRFLMQLEIELANGQTQTIVTDGSWRSTNNGPIRSDGIYDGETYDARKEMPGWDAPGFDDWAWAPVRVFDLGTAQLVWQRNEPIRVVQEIKPIRLTQPKPGAYVFDLGQNMVGWCRLTVQGPAGTTVTIRHAEMLNDDGTIYTANLRGAAEIDHYTLRGQGQEVYEPRFTYHGFRYVELTGLPGAPTIDSVLGRVFHSSSPDAGTFICSNPLLNQLMHNIVWTQRANLMSSPTDCPQRDERFGWMGDIQAFSQTAVFNMDMAGFFSKWVRDIRDDQADDGRYPDFAPHPGDPNKGGSGTPAWGDAGTVVPWRMYQNYGDTRLLAEHFDSARRWVDYIHKNNQNLIWAKARGGNYNDWLNADTLIMAGWPKTGGAVPPDILATAFFAHSTEIVAKMAQVLGRQAEADQYGQLFDQIKAAFNKAFVGEDGTIQGNTQAGYALALHFNLLPDALRAKAARHMVDGFARYNGHMSTGIQSSHRLMLELSRDGYHEEACRLVQLRDFPSWGMMIENGATTIWERWDGYVKGRGFQDPGMNSFNHWAFGAVGEWIWRDLAGINPDESQPGFKHFVIHPRPGTGFTWAKGVYDSIRGRIVSDWKIDGDTFTLAVTVPPNTTATVYVPTASAASVREGGQVAATVEGIDKIGVEDGSAVFLVRSGS
ncbi:MAG: family 78 glycoside hydrolase catalytic domain, partial [Candidatus Omnitrophica bacterium]|nr:family 78 glycoside hydrolase catalytic domain [Candidatus Omnitrophota bacterium]